MTECLLCKLFSQDNPDIKTYYCDDKIKIMEYESKPLIIWRAHKKELTNTEEDYLMKRVVGLFGNVSITAGGLNKNHHHIILTDYQISP